MQGLKSAILAIIQTRQSRIPRWISKILLALGSYEFLLLKKETKVNSDFLLMKSSKKCLILLPTFYLMKAPKNFEKNAILEI